MVAEENGEVIGYTALSYHKEGVAVLAGMYVHPDHTGNGAGTMLMNQLLKTNSERRPIELEVASYNEGAIRFYQRFGFGFPEPDKVEKHELEDGKYFQLKR